MKQLLIIPFLLILQIANAQKASQEGLKKIESAKIALISERLELTPDQAEKFWPLYKAYDQNRRKIKKDIRVERKNFNPNEATEEENKRMLQMTAKAKQQEFELEAAFTNEILDVISPRQFNNLKKAEIDFREIILKKIKAKREKHD